MLDWFSSRRCDKCNDKIEGEWGLMAPELEGAPFVCSSCVMEVLTGKRYTWKMREK